jgi:exopolyphosphatase / guanosine-5'-triphosphate,3'-diphosphate pyrophosphatase
VLETSEQTRLGKGFYTAHRLQPASIAHTAQVISAYAREAQAHEARSVRVIATSAVRDAVNQSELLEAVRTASGLAVDIISGEQEAAWAFRGIATDPRFAGQALLVLDVGGGSLQVIIGDNAESCYRHSFRMGSVRLFEELNLSDPPKVSERERCDDILNRFIAERFMPAVQAALEPTRHHLRVLVGTGGTCTLLATLQAKMVQFDRDQIELIRVHQTQLSHQCDHLWQLTLAQRRGLPGLPPNKADIILTGAAIYLAIMRALGFDELQVSTRGIRFGALVADANEHGARSP